LLWVWQSTGHPATEFFANQWIYSLSGTWPLTWGAACKIETVHDRSRGQWPLSELPLRVGRQAVPAPIYRRLGCRACARQPSLR